MNFDNILVTVGTTQFESLIEKLNHKEVHEILKSLNCKELRIQVGTGNIVKFNIDGIKIESFRLKPEGLQEDILWANLVISHAGAGTCIDVLNLKKPLIVVVNEGLMKNHQLEIAEQLFNDGYLLYTTVTNLPETLKSINLTSLKEFHKGNIDKFVQQLDMFMNFQK